jgi:adenosine kinase
MCAQPVIGVSLDYEGAAQLGCAMAALVMEASGTQEYRFQQEEFLARIGESYGAQVAAKMAVSIGPTSPSRAKEKV